jgi:Protein of unknown function (DUF3501)
MATDASPHDKLTLEDIADLRAYERERDELRARVIALKRLRRVSVGPIITLVFESQDTIRFQVQEMVRAERMLTDEAVQTELDTYNPLIPQAGQLSATMFVELTSKAQLEEWLPKLVGVERSMVLVIGEGDGAAVVHGVVEEEHAAQLTREEMTASVHYVRFELSPAEVAAFAAGPVALGVDHPSYAERTPLSPETKAELLLDLR